MNLNIKNLQYIFINYKEDSLKQMLCASTKAKGALSSFTTNVDLMLYQFKSCLPTPKILIIS